MERTKILNTIEYGKIERYPWGILDTSTELHRAIKLSSCLISDPSSIVSLYQVTGKPVMIQKCDSICDSEFDFRICCGGICADAESIWMVPRNFNALFKMDTTTHSIDYCGTVPDELLSAKIMCRSLIKFQNKLFLAPYNAKEIAIYHIDTKQFDKIQILPVKDCNDNYFYSALLVGKMIYFIPRKYPAVVRLNIETNQLDYYDRFLKELEPPYFDCYVFADEKILMPSRTSNKIIEFNIKTNSSRIFHSDRCSNILGICFDGYYYWLLGEDGTIVRRRFDTDDACEETVLLPDLYLGKAAFWPLKYFDGFVWAFPFMAEKTLKIDAVTLKAELSDVFPAKAANERYFPNYYFAEVSDKAIYAHSVYENVMYIFHSDRNDSERIPLILNKEQCRKMKKDRILQLLWQKCNKKVNPGKSEPVFNEKSTLDLEAFLDGIQECSDDNKSHFGEPSAGLKIYDYVKTLILS